VKDTCTGPRIATVQPSPSPTATPTPGSQLTSTYIVAPGGHAGKCAFGFVDTASNATASLPVTNFSNGTPPPTAPPTPTAGPTSTGSLSLLFICPTGPCTGYTFTTPATVTIAVNNPDQSADTQNVEENDTCGGIMKISASPSGYNGWNFKPLAKTGQCSATFTNAQSDPDYPGVSGQFAVTVDIGGLQVRPVR